MDAARSGGVGAKLREARERRGMTLRQIADATKISVAVLGALERNDISRLPGGIFSRAFVRSFATQVGLDPEATVQEFIGQFPHESVTAGHPTSHRVEDYEAVESEQRIASTMLRLVVMSAVVAGLVIYMSSTDRTPEPVGEPAAASPAASPAPLRGVEETVAPVAGVAVAPSATTVEDPMDRLQVSLLATGACWVVAVADGQRVIEREFQAGERQVLEVRRELVLTAGDAAALRVTLNGEDARLLGRAGQVVTVRVTLSNFKELLVSR
jgi:cytoskeleton protein RodZ